MTYDIGIGRGPEKNKASEGNFSGEGVYAEVVYSTLQVNRRLICVYAVYGV
jgi:hypothetical protein